MSDYDPTDKFTFTPWDFDFSGENTFNPPEEEKQKNDSGAIDIPAREYNELYNSLKELYGSALDDIIKALKGYKPEIDVGVKASEVQSVIFSKDKGWTKDKALSWCKSHDYKTYTIRETDSSWRVRQFDPDKCRTQPRTISLDKDKGISAVTCNLSESKKRWTKALSRSGVVAIVTESIRKNGLIQKVIETIVGNVSTDMLTVIKEQSTVLDLGFDRLKEEDAIRRLTERKMSYYQDIPDTLTDTVIQTLVDTIDRGESYSQAVDKLKLLRDDFTTHRAETIVRTEIGRSRKEAKMLFAETHRDLLDKVWLSTLDRRCRNSHLAMNGTKVSIDAPFLVNYRLDNPKYGVVQEQYPGESKFGINCRCELELVKK